MVNWWIFHINFLLLEYEYQIIQIIQYQFPPLDTGTTSCKLLTFPKSNNLLEIIATTTVHAEFVVLRLMSCMFASKSL